MQYFTKLLKNGNWGSVFFYLQEALVKFSISRASRVLLKEFTSVRVPWLKDPRHKHFVVLTEKYKATHLKQSTAFPAHLDL
jgi:hypothetical protein